jgi:anti-anti-sigma factor
MDMEVTDAKGAKAIKVTIRGRLDTAGVDRIETRFLASSVSGGRDTVVDLSGVDLITSMGIRMLIGAARGMSQRKTRLVLFGAQDLVREVLETAAVDALIAMVPAEPDALALVGS